MFKRLLPPLWKRRHRLLLLFVLATVLSLLQVAAPALVKYLIDGMIKGVSTRLLFAASAAILLLALLEGLFDWGRIWVATKMGQDIEREIREKLFTHLTSMPFSFFDSLRTGDIVSRAVSDVEVLSLFYTRALPFLTGNVIITVVVVITLFRWNSTMALACLPLILLLFHSAGIFSRRVRPALGKSRRLRSALAADIREVLAGVHVVKGLGIERQEVERIEKASKKLALIRIRAGTTAAFWSGYPVFLIGMATAAVLWVGGRQVADGATSIGTMAGFVTCFGLLLRPVRQSGMMLALTLRSLASAERVFEILETGHSVTESDDAAELVITDGSIEIRDLCFGYKNSGKLFRELSLSIPGRRLVAFVGPSGAGKTSLAHLIPRFYRIDSGSISIDGQDIYSVSSRSLRRAVGVAFQDSFLFDATIRDNIAWGSPDASEERIVRAAFEAQLASLLEALPEGLDTKVGPRGYCLSGGERQRVALARVLLYDPAVLILDEPTSSVDRQAEKRLQDVLEHLRKSKTVIVIAHRFLSVRHADMIVLFDKGRIVARASGDELGSAHEKLVGQSSLYVEMLEAQGGCH